MPGKFFVLVLHSHIPYVLAHGSWPHGMGWLYEAAAGSYLPLLDAFERRAAEHCERALTLLERLEAGRPLTPCELSLLEVFESEDRIFEEVVCPDGSLV